MQKIMKTRLAAVSLLLAMTVATIGPTSVLFQVLIQKGPISGC